MSTEKMLFRLFKAIIDLLTFLVSSFASTVSLAAAGRDSLRFDSARSSEWRLGAMAGGLLGVAAGE